MGTGNHRTSRRDQASQRAFAKRRAEKARAKGVAVDPVIAHHEAGHAVGRILTNEVGGHRLEGVLQRVDIYPVATSVGGMGERLTDRRAQATTYGTLFTKEIDDFLDREGGEGGHRAAMANGFTVNLAHRMRAAGLNVNGWLFAKTISTLLGPMAEAKFLGEPLGSIFDNPACQGDLRDIAMYAGPLELSDEQFEDLITKAFAVAKAYLDHLAVWRAIQAVAAELKIGQNPGHKLVPIIERELKELKDAA
jgi:hypothetical protein